MLTLLLVCSAMASTGTAPGTLRDLYEDAQRLYRKKGVVTGVRLAVTELFEAPAIVREVALEHGVLVLDSSIKHSVDGFTAYYQERAKRLAELDKAEITIDVEHECEGSKGSLLIRVGDSGKGFDYQKILAAHEELTQLSGRGIPLVLNLCDQVTFQDGGRVVEAVYSWS